MIDVASLDAIDVHVHTERSRAGHDPMPAHLRDAAARYFGGDPILPTVDEVADYYRRRNMAAVVFTVDWESQSGLPPISNEEIAEGAAANADVLIPFASVDPARPDAIERARRLIAEHGVKGFKFHPNLQAFFPNDRSAYPLYEAISVCLHKANVWIDLSGWSPKYFPPQLVQYANTQLREKVLFGSDFPLITPDRWLADFAQAPFKEQVRPLILKENAIRLLGLG